MTPTPVLCLAPVGWPQVASRPRQLMTRLAADRPVYFFETQPRTCRLPLVGSMRAGALTVLTPYLPESTSAADGHRLLAPLLEASLDSDGASGAHCVVLRCSESATGRGDSHSCDRLRLRPGARRQRRGRGVGTGPGRRGASPLTSPSTRGCGLVTTACTSCRAARPGRAPVARCWPSSTARPRLGSAAPARTAAPKTRRYRVIRGGAEPHRRQPWL